MRTPTSDREGNAGEGGTAAGWIATMLIAIRIAASAAGPFRRREPETGSNEEASGSGKVFEPHQKWSPRQRRMYATFEVAYTLVDFSAAMSFVIGSILFFYAEYQTEGTWMFLIGSILFALKPTLRLVREIVYVGMGRTGQVARKAQG